MLDIEAVEKWQRAMKRRERLQEQITEIIYTSRPIRKGEFCNDMECTEGCQEVIQEIMLAIDQTLLNHVLSLASDKTYEEIFEGI